MGTAPFAVPSLERLHGLGYPILAVYSQPPRPAGRGHKVHKSALHEAADRLGIEVRTPRTLRDPEVQAEFARWGRTSPWWALTACCCRGRSSTPRASAA
jgi:methionyl-tRNA formyltransferase